MRLLVAAPTFPVPADNGFKMRTWSLLRALAEEGHDITLLCFAATDHSRLGTAEIRKICRVVEIVPLALPSMSMGKDYPGRLRALASPLPYGVTRFRSVAMAQAIREWLRVAPFDAALSETPYALINFPSSLPVPLILNNHNIEYRLIERYLAYERNPFRRAYAWLECRKLKLWEKRACLRASMAMVCSDLDRASVEQLAPGVPCAVVPNTIDVASFEPLFCSERHTLLYVGGMDWYPNRDAVEYFISRILPRVRAKVPEVKFIVAGRNPPEKFQRRFAGVPGVEFTGTVPDMREAYRKAAVCVVPLRIGSGTRLKILEAAAWAKPVVATRLGAEGLEFVDGKELIIADDPRDFARAVTSLLRDEQQQRAIGQSARCRVEQNYDFQALCRALRRALGQLDHAPSPISVAA